MKREYLTQIKKLYCPKKSTEQSSALVCGIKKNGIFYLICLSRFEVSLLVGEEHQQGRKTMKKTYLLPLISIVTWSCISEEEQKGIEAVQQIIRAEKIAVGSGTLINTEKGEIKYKTLILKSGTDLNNPSISDESISSLSAFTFFNTVTLESLEGKKAIKIELERNLDGTVKNIETLFYIDTLQMVKNSIIDCEKLCKNFVNQNYSEIYSELHSGIKDIILAKDFESTLMEGDKKFGKVNSYLIKGFKTMTGKKNSDKSNVPIVLFWIELNRDSLTNNVGVKFSMREDVKGILAIDF